VVELFLKLKAVLTCLCAVFFVLSLTAWPIAPAWSDEGDVLPRPPSPSKLQTGADTNLSPSNTYDPISGSSLARLERDFNEVCPCLFIRILSEIDNGTREILVRHPGDVGDLDRRVRNRRNLPGRGHDRRSDDDISEMAEDFCDCYKKHRAGERVV